MIDDGVAGPVKWPRASAPPMPCRRHLATLGPAARWCFDTEVQFALRMTRCLGAELAEILDSVDRQGYPSGAARVQPDMTRGRFDSTKRSRVPPGRAARLNLRIAAKALGDVRQGGPMAPLDGPNWLFGRASIEGHE